MSKALARLLDQPERLLARAVDKLENANGYTSEDVRFLADNSNQLRKRLAEIGLDPDDTTGAELYHALIAKFDKDSALLDKSLGVDAGTAMEKRLDRASELLENLTSMNEIWVLKYSAAKKTLQALPPKKLMKLLKYRSVDSLLKRENIAEICMLLPHVESVSWQKNFAKAVSKLDTTDYELRKPLMMMLSSQRWADIGSPDSAVLTNNLVGAVGLRPLDSDQKAGSLNIALLLMEGLESLTHSESLGSIAHLSPALRWWEQSKHLVALCGNQPVSLNFKDVAADYLSGASFNQRASQYGRQSLWDGLLSRYENSAPANQGNWNILRAKSEEEFNKLLAAALPPNLAREYVEA